MMYYCECWKDDPEEGRFDTTAPAIVDVKIDPHGNFCEDDYPEWDYSPAVGDEYHEGNVTCGCCGEDAEIIWPDEES
jgi:hypothetical protein